MDCLDPSVKHPVQEGQRGAEIVRSDIPVRVLFRSVDKLYDLEEEDYLAVMRTVKMLAANMEKVLGRRTLLKVVGTDVPHAHVHLTSLDENYKYGQEVQMTEAEMREMQEKLKK